MADEEFGISATTNIQNSLDIVYICGNENTNGSIRIILNAGDTLCHIERRADDVWNYTGMRFSLGSIEFGRDFTVGGAASFIETFNEAIADEHQRALIPHIPFDDAGTRFPHTPFLDVLKTDVIFSTAISEISATTIGISFLTDHARFVSSIMHEVGTVGASAEIVYSIYSGTDNTGILIHRKTIPASAASAGSTLTVMFGTTERKTYVGLNDATTFFIELVSTAAFSLKTDVSNNPLMSFIEQHLATMDLVTEDLIYDTDLNHVLDNNLDPIYANQF